MEVFRMASWDAELGIMRAYEEMTLDLRMVMGRSAIGGTRWIKGNDLGDRVRMIGPSVHLCLLGYVDQSQEEKKQCWRDVAMEVEMLIYTVGIVSPKNIPVRPLATSSFDPIP